MGCLSYKLYRLFQTQNSLVFLLFIINGESEGCRQNYSFDEKFYPRPSLVYLQQNKKKARAFRLFFFVKKKERRFGEELCRPALSRATASLEVRRGGLRLVFPSRAPHGKKVRCITSHQSQPRLHNQWSRLVDLVCVPFWNTGPYSLVSPPHTYAVQKPEKWRQHRHQPGNK